MSSDPHSFFPLGAKPQRVGGHSDTAVFRSYSAPPRLCGRKKEGCLTVCRNLDRGFQTCSRSRPGGPRNGRSETCATFGVTSIHSGEHARLASYAPYECFGKTSELLYPKAERKPGIKGRWKDWLPRNRDVPFLCPLFLCLKIPILFPIHAKHIQSPCHFPDASPRIQPPSVRPGFGWGWPRGGRWPDGFPAQSS